MGLIQTSTTQTQSSSVNNVNLDLMAIYYNVLCECSESSEIKTSMAPITCVIIVHIHTMSLILLDYVWIE